jgi:hypothetical protein
VEGKNRRRRKMFPTKSALSLSLLLVLLCPGAATAQQRAKERQGGEAKPKALSDEAQLLQWKATQVLNTLDQSVTDINGVPDRVRVLVEIADALWLVDEVRARSLFTRGFEEVDKLSADSQIDRKRLPDIIQALHYRVLSRAARRDPQLANQLVRSLPDMTPTADQKWAATYGSGTPNGEALLGVAQNLLATDPQQSTALAKLSLPDGLSQGLRLYLISLRAKDPVAADALFESALVSASARHPSRLIEVLFLWDYAYQPANFYFGGISWDRDRGASQYAVAARLKHSVLLFAINAIKENAQFLLNPPAEPDQLAKEQGALLYAAVQQVLPSVQADLPESAPYLHALLVKLEGDMRAAGQKTPTPPSTTETSDASDNSLDKLLERIANTAQVEARDDLYLQAAFQLFRERNYSRAAKVAEKIEDTTRRDMILEPINFNQAGEMVSAGSLEEALKLAGDLKAPELRVMMLARIGQAFLEKDDNARASQVLGEAQAIAAKAEPSVALSSSVLSIALAFNQLDQLRSSEALTRAIEMMNKVKEDNALWALLSASGGAGPLTATNFSWKASDNGGLKWVKVNYPRATGLTEALSKTSQRDFDQAVSAARQIRVKGLSLAVQAAICRAAIESVRKNAASRRS